MVNRPSALDNEQRQDQDIRSGSGLHAWAEQTTLPATTRRQSDTARRWHHQQTSPFSVSLQSAAGLLHPVRRQHTEEVTNKIPRIPIWNRFDAGFIPLRSSIWLDAARQCTARSHNAASYQSGRPPRLCTGRYQRRTYSGIALVLSSGGDIQILRRDGTGKATLMSSDC